MTLDTRSGIDTTETHPPVPTTQTTSPPAQLKSGSPDQSSSSPSRRLAALSALLGPGNFSRIAASTGLSRAHVSRVLRGKARASVPIAKQIAEAASITLDDLDAYIESYQERRRLPDTRDPDRSSTRPVTDTASLGARIRKQREAKGWTQDELAREVGGIDSTYVSKIEHGRRVPDLGTLQKILGVLAGESEEEERGERTE